MIPLTEIIRRLADEMFNVQLPDAGSTFGSQPAIRAMCSAAGFSHVQVLMCSLLSHSSCGLLVNAGVSAA